VFLIWWGVGLLLLSGCALWFGGDYETWFVFGVVCFAVFLGSDLHWCSGVYLVGCGLYVGVWLTWSVSVSAVLLVLRCLCCVV